MRILLVEDHHLLQEKLAALLHTECDAVDLVSRGDEVLDAVLRLQPDAVVLDVSLPGRSGLHVLADLRNRHPALALVVLTTYEDPIYQSEAVRRGADAYIVKRRAIEELLPAVRHSITTRQATVPVLRQ